MEIGECERKETNRAGPVIVMRPVKVAGTSRFAMKNVRMLLYEWCLFLPACSCRLVLAVAVD